MNQALAIFIGTGSREKKRRVRCGPGVYEGQCGVITGSVGMCYNVRLDSGENISGGKRRFTILKENKK